MKKRIVAFIQGMTILYVLVAAILVLITPLVWLGKYLFRYL